MNRTTVVFLALAILLAHTIAIHQTPDGDFAAPYERAHAAFRLGRNLAHEGRAVWNPALDGSPAYPSLAWVSLAALAEHTNFYSTHVAQALGILCTLASVIVLAQFSSERLAGLIAPVLFAASGSIAAAAASGTEAPLALFFLTTAFLAFERGWRYGFALAVAGLFFTRPEGAPMLAAFALLYALDPPRDAESGAHRVRSGLAIALAAVVALFVARGWLTETWIAPWTSALLEFDAERLRLGLGYVTGFAIGSATAPLLFLPILLTCFRRLSGIGRRALALFFVWVALVTLSGGDELPFWNALAPALPLALLSIQNAITGWIDDNPSHAPAAWGVLSLTGMSSFLVSMFPADLGPLPLRNVLETWMRPPASVAEAFPRPMGRAGLLEEIRDSEALRSIGIFLRDKVAPDATIATFWPGAIGFLSRKEVHDLLGRTEPSAGTEDPRSWSGHPRVDLVRALEIDADYLVTSLGRSSSGPLASLPRIWLRRFDVVGDEPERVERLMNVLAQYEVISVPVPLSSRDPNSLSPSPFVLLRHKDLALAPELEVRTDGSRFDVEVRSEGHRQIVDLAVRLVADTGESWSLRPTGEWTPTDEIDARTDVLLYATGSRSVRMLRGWLPDEFRGSLTARLHSPGVAPTSPFATVGEPMSVRIEGR